MQCTANAFSRLDLIQEACAQNAKDKSMHPHGWKKITIKMNSIIIPASTDNNKSGLYMFKRFHTILEVLDHSGTKNWRQKNILIILSGAKPTAKILGSSEEIAKWWLLGCSE